MTEREIAKSNEQVEKLLKRQSEVGAKLTQDLKGRTKGDPNSAMYSIGDEIVVPNDENKLFKNVFGDNSSYGVVCSAKSADGTISAKALYFSALDRSVAEYSEALERTGKIVYASTKETHDVYDKVHDCATDYEVWQLIKGKTLKVVAQNNVVGARFSNRLVTGTRKRNIPVFDWA